MKSLAVVIVVGFAVMALPADARPDDVVGWQTARWGMTTDEIDRAFSGDLSRLREPWQFGGSYAARSLATALGGVEFLALFQMNAGNQWLQQVMLETRLPRATPAAHRRVAEQLAETYGPADLTCVHQKVEGEPMLVERI